jgi:hypothetical protein
MYQLPPVAYISLFSPILPISIGILKIKETYLGMTILLFYLITALAGDIILMWFIPMKLLRLGLVHAYFIIEYVFIISIISTWQESRRMRRLFQGLIFLFITFWTIAKFTFEPLNGLYIYTASTSQVVLSLGAAYTLFIVVGNRMQPLIHNYRFWALLSFVIYYTGTLLVIALRGFVFHHSPGAFIFVNSIDWSLKILFNILLTIGFLCPQTRA